MIVLGWLLALFPLLVGAQQPHCGPISVEQEHHTNGMWFVYLQTNPPWRRFGLDCSSGRLNATFDLECTPGSNYTKVAHASGNPYACKYEVPSVCRNDDYDAITGETELLGRFQMTREHTKSPYLWNMTFKTYSEKGSKLQVHCKANRPEERNTIVFETMIHDLKCVQEGDEVKWKYEGSTMLSSLGFGRPGGRFARQAEKSKKETKPMSPELQPATNVCKISF